MISMSTYTASHLRYHERHKDSLEYRARRAKAMRAYRERKKQQQQTSKSSTHEITVTHGGKKVVLQLAEPAPAAVRSHDTPHPLWAGAELCPFAAGFA